MPSLETPVSDVVSADKPYRATIAFAGGDPMPVELAVTLRRQGGVPFELRCPVRRPRAGRLSNARLEIAVDASSLAEGEYEGEVTAGGDTWSISFFRMPDRTRDEFPFGMYAVNYESYGDDLDGLVEELHESGINLLCQHMSNVESQAPFLDRAARRGMQFCPSTNLSRNVDDSRTTYDERTRSRLRKGMPKYIKRGKAAPCFNNPKVRLDSSRALQKMLENYKGHPAFSNLVYYGDDLFLAARAVQGRAWISCYCDHCRSDFKKKFGYEPPVTTELKTGVVATDDPWLTWMRYRCADNYGGLMRKLHAAKDRTDENVKMGLCHGWPDNPFVAVWTGIYSPLSQPLDVVSSYCYPFLRAAASEIICHYEMAKMGNRDKDVWMLGILEGDGVIVPPWEVSQNYWNMLAAGYKFIAFFSWYGVPAIVSSKNRDHRRRAAESLAELRKCGKHKDWILPTAAHWEDCGARTAALFSFTTEAFDIEPRYQGHLHTKRVCDLYSEAMRHQTPMKIICEEEVRAGMLDEFDTICLRDARVLPEDVRDKIQAYADSGKTVLTDHDPLYTDAWHPSRKIEIKGAIELAPDSMIAYLCDRTERPVTVSNPHVTARRFRAGKVEYHVFVNNYASRYRGMPYSYGDPEANYKLADLVTSEPVRATVRFAEAGRWLYDMSTGKPAGTTDRPLRLNLKPAWGRVLAALPCDRVAMSVTVPAAARLNKTARIGIEMRNEAGRRVSGAFTAKVTALAPSGRTSRYSGFISIAKGRGVFLLPLGANDETGKWTIKIEGGFPRTQTVHTIKVPGKAPGGAGVETRWARTR